MQRHIKIFIFSIGISGFLRAQIINTFAGTGIQGFSGDGGLCTSAKISGPRSAAFDTQGNIYISDYLNKRIRKITPAGIITTYAGTGIQGYSGDGGPAVNAKIYNVNAMAFDATGNLYFTDTQNNRIRKINSSGIITTIAGNGTQGYTGDGGLATNAQLADPTGIAIDASGNIYFSEANYYKIRKINTSGIITTIAGTSQGYSGDGGAAINAKLNYPEGLAFDLSGNLYFADEGNNCVRKINTSGIILTVAGTGVQGSSGDGGTATNALLNSPIDVDLDASGNLYIADYSNHKIRKVDASGIITTFAGTGVAGYSGDGGIAANAQLHWPEGVDIDPLGNVYIGDWWNNRYRKIDCILSPITVNASSTLVCSGSPVILTAGGANSYTWSSGVNSVSATVNPIVNSTYSVNGIYNGCVLNTVTISIAVKALPSLSITSVIISCAGPVVNLTASGATSYSWSNGVTNGVPFTPGLTTTYTVYGTGPNSCTNIATQSVSVIHPSITISNSLICLGETSTLNVTTADTYTWSTGDNTNSIIVSPTLTSTYSVVITKGSCNYSLSVIESVDKCVGIEGRLGNASSELSVFPNPFVDRIVVLNNSPTHSTSRLKIYDTLGLIVYADYIISEKKEIDLVFIRSGVYFLEVNEPGNNSRIKLIKSN